MLSFKFVRKDARKVPALLRVFPSQAQSSGLLEMGSKHPKFVSLTSARNLHYRWRYVCSTGVPYTHTGSPISSLERQKQNNCTQFRTFTEDRKTTALALIKDLKHLRSSPIPALVLGVAGVIPFAAAPAYIIYSGHFVSAIAFGQAAYGACILSFLGGVRWGLTVSPDESVRPDWFNLGYSVTPSLVAWIALLLPTTPSILVLITGLLGACFMDVTLWGYPPWFKALRFLLTFMAVLSLWTTFMCWILLKAEKKEEKKIKEEVVVKEKSSWFKLPWKSSKATPRPELPSNPVAEVPAKVEEPVQNKPAITLPEPPMTLPDPPMTLPDPPMESAKPEGSDNSGDAGDTNKGKAKELRW